MNACPISVGADDGAVAFDQAAVGLLGNSDLRDAGHGQRIGDAGEQREQRQQHERGAKMGEHDSLLQAADREQRGDDEVDDLDADERHDDAAEPVDQQVAPQQRRGADRRDRRRPCSASGISAMMISALKMTADRIALCGVASPMTLSACSCG